MRIKCLQNVISMDELSKFYQKKRFSVILDTDFPHKIDNILQTKVNIYKYFSNDGHVE
jgi:hypothetical protein